MLNSFLSRSGDNYFEAEPCSRRFIDEPMMKALIRDRYGPPEVLEARDSNGPHQRNTKSAIAMFRQLRLTAPSSARVEFQQVEAFMRGMCFGLSILLVAANLLAKDISRGEKITVRTSTIVSSDRSLFGDPLDAVLVNDLVINGKIIAPSGALAHGVVSSATPSRKGKLPIPGSVSIRLETIETSQGIYHLSTNQYTRQGKGSSRSPSATTGGGISIDPVGGVQTQSPIPETDPSEVTLGGAGSEAIIPPQSVITFKVAATQRN